jgi:hypothetical protein
MNNRAAAPQRGRPRPAEGSKFRRLSAFLGWLVAGLLVIYLAIDKLHPASSSGEPPSAPTAAPPSTALPAEPAESRPTPHPYLYPTWKSTPSLSAVHGSPTGAQNTHGPRETPRPAPTSPSSPDVAPTHSLSPGPESTPHPLSGLDAEREKAAFLVPALDRLVQDRDRLATLEGAYKRDCWGASGSIGSPESRMQLSGTPACLSHESMIKELQSSLSRECAAAKDAAHKGGVLPGILRELAGARGLEQCLSL